MPDQPTVTLTIPAAGARLAAEELYAAVRVARDEELPHAEMLEAVASALHAAGWAHLTPTARPASHPQPADGWRVVAISARPTLLGLHSVTYERGDWASGDGARTCCHVRRETADAMRAELA